MRYLLLGFVALIPYDETNYKGDGVTQRIVVLDNRDDIRRVPVTESKWKQSGGMEGIIGWKSEKFKYIPGPVKTWIGDISVKNEFNNYQNNRGIKRLYPEGTRFSDILKNDEGIIFEIRTRTKIDGVWNSDVAYKNEEARPKGYTGLKVTCASCHREAGTGEYGLGLVPGGDGNFSDPLDWAEVDTNIYKRIPR